MGKKKFGVDGIHIPAVRLPKAELEQHYGVMVKGNKFLNELADLSGMNRRDFRGKILKMSDKELLSLSSETWHKLSQKDCARLVQVMPAIRAVQKIEWTMICCFVGLVHRHASVWSRKSFGSNIAISEEDYFQEGLMALVDAIYSYTDSNIKFITFAWLSISNRLRNAHNRYSPMPLTNRAVKLLAEFDRVKVSMNRPVSDEEVIAAMFTSEAAVVEEAELEEELAESELAEAKRDGNDAEIAEAKTKLEKAQANTQQKLVAKDKQEKALRRAMIRMINTTQLEVENDDFSQHDDYTQLRAGIDTEAETERLPFDVDEAIRRANLTVLEHQVLTSSLEGRGMVDAVTLGLVNRETGKPISRQRVHQILTKAREKVRAVVEEAMKVA